MIRVNNLSKQFDSRGIAGLHALNFTLNKGIVMGIMGPNGSGKTTLLKILSGQLNSDQGNFETDGSVSLFPTHEILTDMNVQKFLISKVTIDVDDEKKIQLARDLADTFEFTFQLRQNLFQLSSGQRQKVLLAAELINRPALLLMDEPFTHLDPFTRRDILNGLFQFIRQQGITVLWVTHELEEALKYSDIVGLMNFGRLEQLGTPLSLLRNPRNLFVAQFMGYQNFIPVKFEQGVAETPWGKWNASLANASEGIMVIPDNAWKMNEGLEAQIEESYGTRQGIEHRLRFDGRQLVLKTMPTVDVQEKVKIMPIWEECFLIPL
ncbi:ATP-binding cassette domain-containing protein [Peredibacter starrii]|uniref:ATP-binding cassette domain-containing protein n=1 Tax=Peredibacter starrii TaxID=28202 RepID=A0AAX4HS14_9BACT|nr:ATP-binding cassette domain-containing protein [Peredibacter starrii]WPU66089.1 ATP-binding cassette domain-containing protein [Peredibacter starrii]